MPSPRLVARTATLPHDATTVAVVADTHSQPHPSTLALLAARRPAAILHAGDIGDPAVLADLETVAPVHAVRGNIDARGLPDVLTIDVDGRGLRILLLHIGVAGPRLRADAAALAKREEANLVICGHSHVPFVGRHGAITVFNPGSCGPRRFHLPIVFGTMAIGDAGVKLAHVDCETGAAWLPP